MKKTNKMFAVILSVIMMISVFPMAANAQTATEGDGTALNPYSGTVNALDLKVDDHVMNDAILVFGDGPYTYDGKTTYEHLVDWYCSPGYRFMFSKNDNIAVKPDTKKYYLVEDYTGSTSSSKNYYDKVIDKKVWKVKSISFSNVDGENYYRIQLLNTDIDFYTFDVDEEQVGKFNNSDTTQTADAKTFAFKTSMQTTDRIFTGWKLNNKFVDSTKTFATGNYVANFRDIGVFGKDVNDEKQIGYYSEFGLAGVQIRRDDTIELEVDEKDQDVYGGLRFIASASEELLSNLNVIEYGFVVATKENADKNASGNSNYVIKNGDQNVKKVKCSGSIDHRNFSDYRLFTMVIDYQGNEELKDTNIVARPYIAYKDSNGVNRIFYGSYDGTVTYGGCSVSYNRAVALSK